MKKTKLFILLLALVILTTSISLPAQEVEAKAKKTITIGQYINLLVPAIDKNATKPYLDYAIEKGIVREGEFNLKAKLTRTDAAIIANRADNYLGKTKISATKIDKTLDKRISDIKKVNKNKRYDVASIVAKGIIKGYSNGMYIQNRQFKGSDYITRAGAKNVIDLVVNPSKRAKTSPDGQLIRTTKLPKGKKGKGTPVPNKEFPYIVGGYPKTKDYDYILASFPNSFYEMKFGYQVARYGSKQVELKDYASPKRLKKMSYSNDYYETQNAIKLYKDLWVEKVETNLERRLNVDYRTIEKDNKWYNGLLNTYYLFNSSNDKYLKNDIKDYINYVKKNKVIIKSQIIAVEPSTLHDNGNGFYIRTYVKFKVVSANDMKDQDNIFFDGGYFPEGLKKDKWVECVMDISLNTRNGYDDGSGYRITRNRVIEDQRKVR